MMEVVEVVEVVVTTGAIRRARSSQIITTNKTTLSIVQVSKTVGKPTVLKHLMENCIAVL